jgi:uncharacterized caspase-like protein
MSVAGLLVSCNAALADKRVAFVVGNGAYKNVPALPNPAVDARSMTKRLRNVGFEVVEGSKLGAAINVDLTLEQTMGDAKVKLVFLDACCDNPFAAKIRSAKATRSVTVQTGLAEMKSGQGTLLAFATGPGGLFGGMMGGLFRR